MAGGKVVRCKACGKRINGQHAADCSDRPAVRIEVGDVNGDDGVVEFSRKKQWGYMHHRCFLRAIGAPIV